MRQNDLLEWMDKKPSLDDCKRRGLHINEIYRKARKGMLDLSREDLLEIHFGSSAHGQFFTPDPVARFIAFLGEIQAGESVLDPCAGLGNLMLPALRYTSKVRGIELLRDTVELATTYLDLDITRGDALKMDWGEPDVILMNPPYGTFHKGLEPNWYNYKYRPKKEVAFLHKAVETAKRRTVAIVPNALLSNKRTMEIRKHILENRKLLASIDLPSGTFYKTSREVNKWRYPVTNAHTGILVIDRVRDRENYKVFMAMPSTVDDLENLAEKWREFRELHG